LRKKQLKLPEGHKFPTTQELQGDRIASGITYSPTPPTTARSSVDKFNRLLSMAD
jgi:hypothetical protein